MDFGTLLQTAKENEHNKNKSVRSYSTTFSAPKKVEKKDRALSANIQKFLARKEAEEKKRALADNRKRDELLALRSKDKKATRRVNVMLKRTKSANQSVIEDAVDKDNTAVTLAGPSQPDEDDYGYVSQEAAAYYNKMMEKYNKIPDDPKFSLNKKKASSNLSSTKDRVKAALEREKEEAMLPHRRKRKHKEQADNEIDDSNEKADDDTLRRGEVKSDSAKVKQKSVGPPPMNFSDLLKLAAQKQHEPIMIEVKPKEEEGTLMTKKQKKEQERVQQWKDGKKQNNKMPPVKSNSEQVENRIPKLSSVQLSNHKPKEVGDKQISKSSNSYKNNGRVYKGNIQEACNNLSKSGLMTTTSQNMKIQERGNSALRNALKTQKSASKLDGSANKFDITKQKPLNNLPKKSLETKLMANKTTSSLQVPEKRILGPQRASSSSVIHSTSKPVSKPITNTNSFKKDLKIDGSSKEFNKQKPVTVKETELPPKRFPPNDLKPKQFPPKDLKSKQFPPPEMRRKEFSQKEIKRKPPLGSKRRILDDDDDYDSEMDDFIDDGPEEMEDYSKYIKDIFGYDKSRYRGMDEDDIDNMETSFAQQMREDIRSTKLGIMEDLEDIQREKEEKKRKALLQKRRL